jgi:hypothetical protein
MPTYKNTKYLQYYKVSKFFFVILSLIFLVAVSIIKYIFEIKIASHRIHYNLTNMSAVLKSDRYSSILSKDELSYGWCLSFSSWDPNYCTLNTVPVIK